MGIFDFKYNEMIKALNLTKGYFEKLSSSEKKEMYNDYLIVKRLISSRGAELKKVYGEFYSVHSLWHNFRRAKNELITINESLGVKMTIKEYFLLSEVKKSQLKLESQKMENHLLQGAVFNHPAVEYRKMRSLNQPDSMVEENIRLNVAIEEKKKELERKNRDIQKVLFDEIISYRTGEVVKVIQQLSVQENLKNEIVANAHNAVEDLVNKYRQIVSDDPMACDALLSDMGEDLIIYVVSAKKRLEIESKYFLSGAYSSKPQK